MKDATPARVRSDGSIQLTDRDRAALGLAVVVATESDLPDSTLRFGHVLSPPSNTAEVVSPVTGRITRPAVVQLGASVRAGIQMFALSQPGPGYPSRHHYRRSNRRAIIVG